MKTNLLKKLGDSLIGFECCRCGGTFTREKIVSVWFGDYLDNMCLKCAAKYKKDSA